MDTPSRRRFLAGVSLAGLALGRKIVVGSEDAGRRKMTMQLDCGSIGVRANLVESIELARRHGFESVSVPVDEIRRLSQEELEATLARLKDAGIVFGSSGLPVNFRKDDASFESGLRELPATAAALERAGVTRMGTWITPGSNELTYLRNFEVHRSRLRQIAVILADRGIRLGLEYVGPKTSWSRFRYPFVHTLAETRELIDGIGSDHVGVVLDSWHWYTAHESGDDLMTLTGRDVVAVDLNDAPAGKEVDEQMDLSRELPCATGVIDVATFLRCLERIGFDGPIRAEPFNAELRKLPAEEALAATASAMKTAFAKIREG